MFLIFIDFTNQKTTNFKKTVNPYLGNSMKVYIAIKISNCSHSAVYGLYLRVVAWSYLWKICSQIGLFLQSRVSQKQNLVAPLFREPFIKS